MLINIAEVLLIYNVIYDLCYFHQHICCFMCVLIRLCVLKTFMHNLISFPIQHCFHIPILLSIHSILPSNNPAAFCTSGLTYFRLRLVCARHHLKHPLFTVVGFIAHGFRTLKRLWCPIITKITHKPRNATDQSQSSVQQCCGINAVWGHTA